MFNYLLILVVSLLVGFFLDRYFRVRPKVSADIKDALNGKWGSRPGLLPNQIEMYWQRELILINNTKHEALEVKLIWPKNEVLLDIKISPHTNVSSHDKIEVPFTFTKSFPRDQVVAAGPTRESLTPPALKETQFVITYSNEKGKQFYTLFKFQEGKESNNSFHFLLPRL